MPRLAVALLAALALASAVSAATGGRITARLQPGAVAGTANQAWTATAVVRHGKRAFSGRVIFSIAGETGRRAIPARRTRRPGRYSARIVFPAGGQWNVSLRAGRRTIRLLRVDVKGTGPRISRPHGFELAEEHGDLLVPDMDGTGFYEVSLRTRAKTLVGAGFEHPMFLNFGPGGFLYVADEGRIWRFEPDGSKTPIAGNGTRGLAGDGGPATSAQLGGHGDFAFDAAGNLYISEYDNGVRVVTPDGRIDTLGGIGREGYSGDGGPARLAAFGAPHGLDALADGTVVVADSHNGVNPPHRRRDADRHDNRPRLLRPGRRRREGRRLDLRRGREARPHRPHRSRREPDAARPSAAAAELGRRRPRRQVRLRERVRRPPHQQDRLTDGTGLGARQALTTMLPTTLSCSAWLFLSQSGHR